MMEEIGFFHVLTPVGTRAREKTHALFNIVFNLATQLMKSVVDGHIYPLCFLKKIK
jgi:hypothetical protein